MIQQTKLNSINKEEKKKSTKYGIEENQIFKLTKNCVNIIPCIETSQKESETYQTKCLKVTNVPAHSSL